MTRTQAQTEQAIRINDIQIVNGLQTTYTIWDFYRRGGDISDVKVVVKISESPELKQAISIASNSQSAITGWDFVSQDPNQIRLQEEFAALNGLSLFYELRRGEQRHIRRTTGPKVKPKELAQTALCFLGEPVEAKDRIRLVEGDVQERVGKYANLFSDSITARHLALPYVCWHRVKQEMQSRQQRFVERELTPPAWLGEGHFHLVSLVARGLMQQADQDSYLSMVADECDRLRTTMDEWFMPLFERAFNAINYEVDIERATCERTNTVFRVRQMFKRDLFIERFARQFDLLENT